MAEQWYYAKGGQQHGPINAEGLKQLAATGRLQPSDLVWREGMPAWRKPARSEACSRRTLRLAHRARSPWHLLSYLPNRSRRRP